MCRSIFLGVWCRTIEYFRFVFFILEQVLHQWRLNIPRSCRCTVPTQAGAGGVNKQSTSKCKCNLLSETR